jgi:hypothetical protein
LSGFKVFVLIYSYVLGFLFFLNSLFVLAIIGLMIFHLIKEGKKPALQSVAEQSGATSTVDNVRNSVTDTVLSGVTSMGF